MPIDNQGTVYECPVCEAGVALKNAQSHLARHKNMGEITPELRDWVYGLESVASKVMAAYQQEAAEVLEESESY